MYMQLIICKINVIGGLKMVGGNRIELSGTTAHLSQVIYSHPCGIPPVAEDAGIEPARPFEPSLANWWNTILHSIFLIKMAERVGVEPTSLTRTVFKTVALPISL